MCACAILGLFISPGLLFLLLALDSFLFLISCSQSCPQTPYLFYVSWNNCNTYYLPYTLLPIVYVFLLTLPLQLSWNCHQILSFSFLFISSSFPATWIFHFMNNCLGIGWNLQVGNGFVRMPAQLTPFLIYLKFTFFVAMASLVMW